MTRFVRIAGDPLPNPGLAALAGLKPVDRADGFLARVAPHSDSPIIPCARLENNVRLIRKTVDLRGKPCIQQRGVHIPV
jgi:hypothetical protein